MKKVNEVNLDFIAFYISKNLFYKRRKVFAGF